MAKAKTRVVVRRCPKQTAEIQRLKAELEAARRAAQRVPEGSAEIARLKATVADLRALLQRRDDAVTPGDDA